MDFINSLIGTGEDLSAFQMSFRTIIVFVVTLGLVRVGGVRIFGRRSSLDTIVLITMGSVLARGIVGASPLLSTMAAAASMILVHRFLSWLSVKNRTVERLIKSEYAILFRDNKIQRKNLLRSGLSENDLMESLRLETKQNSLEKIHLAFIETNGRISFIEKKKEAG